MDHSFTSIYIGSVFTFYCVKWGGSCIPNAVVYIFMKSSKKVVILTIFLLLVLPPIVYFYVTRMIGCTNNHDEIITMMKSCVRTATAPSQFVILWFSPRRAARLIVVCLHCWPTCQKWTMRGHNGLGWWVQGGHWCFYYLLFLSTK